MLLYNKGNKMKEIAVLLIFLISINIIIAQEYELTEVGVMGFLIGGIGVNNNDIEFDLDIINCTMLSRKTGLGISLTPINYKYVMNNHYWSFINFQVLWNYFSFLYKYGGRSIYGSFIGPYILINYAPNFNFREYILSYGIRYTLLGGLDWKQGLFSYLLSTECGFRIIEDKNRFYFKIGIDFISIYYNR